MPIPSGKPFAGAIADFVHNCGHDRVAGETAKYVQRFTSSQELRAAALRAAGNASSAAIDQRPVSVTSPAAIRIFVEHQFGGSTLTESQKAQVQNLMATAVRVLQKYLWVKTPVSGKLLVPASCDVSSGSTCYRYYPEFRSISGADKSCGPVATINPNHIAANAVHG